MDQNHNEFLRHLLGSAKIALHELMATPTLERIPEPQMTMSASDSVEAYHQYGFGGLRPAYHFNSLAVSSMTPLNGTVLDLGSGSAQMISHLAQLRPDLRIYGLDLSDPMIELGRALISKLHLQDRVQMLKGDMTQFAQQIDFPVHTISSMFALHHLPNEKLLASCFQEIKKMQNRQASSVWLFDLSRPKTEQTILNYIKTFFYNVGPTLTEDVYNSLHAAYSFEEFTKVIEQSDLNLQHFRSRFFSLYQCHFIRNNEFDNSQTELRSNLSKNEMRDFKAFKFLFPSVHKLRVKTP